jgi:hypothetical protein
MAFALPRWQFRPFSPTANCHRVGQSCRSAWNGGAAAPPYQNNRRARDSHLPSANGAGGNPCKFVQFACRAEIVCRRVSKIVLDFIWRQADSANPVENLVLSNVTNRKTNINC